MEIVPRGARRRRAARTAMGRTRAARMNVAAARRTAGNSMQKRPVAKATTAADEEAVKLALDLMAASGPRMGEHTGDDEE